MLAYEKGTGVRARVTTRFFGARDGECYPVWHEVGAIVTGDLAKVAVSEGWADGLFETKAPEPNGKKAGGLTGGAKQLSSQPAGQASEKKTLTRRAAKRA